MFTVNSKVEVRFHIDSATWIPDWVKPRLMEKERGRINKDGVLIISSDKTRVQMLNKADCIDKIRTMVFQASEKPKEPSEEEKRKIAAGILLGFQYCTYTPEAELLLLPMFDPFHFGQSGQYLAYHDVIKFYGKFVGNERKYSEEKFDYVISKRIYVRYRPKLEATLFIKKKE
ncbi:hypothetical protein FSP39_015830 [Pinctada imbricata]|uniref:Uncharacterized protein n=1 Tax=Pinctada imbricata TaxID=66713 RepID=A0AA88XSI8_PINIB|nr:hypothetical protein FSP39_015830 [Pinctada imbricata]